MKKIFVALLASLILMPVAIAANYQVKDGAGSTKYFKASGAGDAGDPHIPEHLETNSASILTSAQLLDDAIATIGSAITVKGYAIAGTDGTNARILKTDASGELQVDVLTLPNVTIGAAIPTGTNNIGDVDVLTLPSLPSGTNAIGKLAANSGVDIGDVDVTSVIPGTGATSLGKAEDAGHSTGDTAVPVLAVRNDGGSALAGTDLDYIPLSTDSSGNLRVNVAAGGAGDGAILDGVSSSIKATVLDFTNSNPLAVRLTDTNGDYVAAGAGTQYTEDAAAAADPVGGMMMGVRQDTLTSEVSANGDNIAARFTSKGELYVKQTDAVPVTDNGGSLTVDGTVAATQSGTWNITNVSGTVSLPTGAATETTLSAVKTATELIDDSIVADDAAFTPATTKVNMAGAEFDDTTPDSVNEGDAGAVRMSANRNLYTTIRDAAGNERGANVNASNQLSVSVDNTVTVAAHNVTNAGTFAVQAAQAGTWTLGANSGVDIGDVTINNASGASAVNVQDGGNSLTVDGTVTANAGSGTFTTSDNQTITDNAAFTDGTSKVLMAGFSFDETAGTALTENDAAAARINANRSIINVLEDGSTRGRYATVTAANALKVDGSAVTQPVSGTITASNTTGNVASDGVDSGNPVKIGGIARSSDITAVANADRVDFISDLNGKQIVLPYAIPENFTAGATAAITGTTSTSVIGAPGAGIRLYITSVQITNSHATVGTLVSITDGSGGTTLAECYAAPAGGGCAMTLPVPLRLTANTALHAVCGTTGSNTYVSAQGYKAP